MAYIVMEARYDSECVECEGKISSGDEIVFDSDKRKVYCKQCGSELLESE